jgi:hypothetical protein
MVEVVLGLIVALPGFDNEYVPFMPDRDKGLQAAVDKLEGA